MARMVTLLLSFTLLLVSQTFAEAAPHHVYMGIFAGGDSRNTAGGGWDNEGTYDASGVYVNPYSVDRDMVTWQRKNFAVEQTYMAPDVTTQYLAQNTVKELELIWYHGRVPMVNLTFNSWINCQKTMVELANELANPSSTASRQLSTWAQGLKEWLELGASSGSDNRFLILAFLQEGNHSVCAVESNPGTWDFVDPEAYIAAYRRGRQIIESVLGLEPTRRVQWMFAPVSVSNYFMPGFETYYPGDDVVDWLGLSAYNTGGYTMSGWTFPWQYFETAARPYLDRLGRLAPRKPLAIVQLGSVSFGGDKNKWIEQFLADAIRYPRLYLLIYYNAIVPGEAGMPPGLDWPVFWNDPYDARPYGYSTYLTNMRYGGWLTGIQDPYFVFSPRPMGPAGAFTAAHWDIEGRIAPTSNQYDFLRELRDRSGDADGDGVTNWEELACGLDPLVRDKQTTESDCRDGVDNDANGRTDEDDTAACGDIALSDSMAIADATIRSGEYRYFEFIVPAGISSAKVRLTNLTGNVDLYLQYGARPSLTSYRARSISPGLAEEQVVISSPSAGVWHVLVYGMEKAQYRIVLNISSLVSPKLNNVKAVTACDINRSGKDDIVLSVANYGVQAYVDQGKWSDLSPDGSNPSLFACGDLQGTGRPQVIGLWPGSLKRFSVETWEWTEIPLPASATAPAKIAVRDIDGDGKAEIFGVFQASGTLRMRRGSTGVWETLTLSGYAVPDELLIVRMSGNGAGIVGVWRSLGRIRIYDLAAAIWQDVALPSGRPSVPDVLKAGDIDADGIDDLIAVWNTWNGDTLSTQVRSGFTKKWVEILSGNYPDSMPALIVPADVDGDLKDDIALVWKAWHQIQMYVQYWRGAKLIYDGVAPTFAVAGNFDGDPNGRKDVAFIWPGDIKIWMNNAGLTDVRRFQDVPMDYWANAYINALVNAGATSGCQADDPATFGNEARYCPDDVVNRTQMAVFMLRSLAIQPSERCTGAVFNDVNTATVGDVFCRYIEKFSTLGITSGCGNGNYCPSDGVTRAQMAVFLTRALGQLPGACNGAVFQDVTKDTVGAGFCGYIEKFATLGITAGCGSGKYCPNDTVTRAQMAVFLTRAFLQ